MVTRVRCARENLSKIVVDYIKEKILTYEYLEGDHILETKVANELGISRAPVREGIKELEKEGILVCIPRKGSYVTRFTVADRKEIFDIRLLLENSILEILIKEDKLSEKDFKILEGIISEMLKIADSPIDVVKKTLEINKKDMAFHKFLWEKSGSKRREEILSGIFSQLQIAMMYDTNLSGDLVSTSTDHYEIIKYLKNKNLEKSQKALKEHIIEYREGIFKD